MYVPLWEYPAGYAGPASFVEQVESDVDADGMWSVEFATELGEASYSVGADQRVADVPDGYTEVEFIVTQEACGAVGAGDPSSDGDAAQDQATLANTGGSPLGGLLGAGGLMLVAGAALLFARRRLLLA